MPWENEQNRRSLFPFGNKPSPTTVLVDGGSPMPPGILTSGKPMQTTPTRQPLGDPELTQPRKVVTRRDRSPL
jgi:hypothetical protein